MKENFAQPSISLSMSLLAAVMVKKSHILAGIYFIFLNKAFNTKGSQYQNGTSVKR